MQALSQAKENLQRARAEAAKILQHIDVPRQEEATVLAGPRTSPDAFFAAIRRLDTCILFFSTHKCAGSTVHLLGASAAWHADCRLRIACVPCACLLMDTCLGLKVLCRNLVMADNVLTVAGRLRKDGLVQCHADFQALVSPAVRKMTQIAESRGQLPPSSTFSLKVPRIPVL